MAENLVLRMRDVRRVYSCRAGVKTFFKRHDLDYQGFLKNGTPADILLATGDAMAVAVVDAAKAILNNELGEGV